MDSSDAANVRVSVRIKPSNSAAIFPSPEGVRVEHSKAGPTAHDGFASIISSECDQAETYTAIAAPLMQRLQQGYSCTLLAYGQTGSGKTHTIFGPPGALTEAALDGCEGGGAPADWGLFPRIALELLAAGAGTLHASAVEVYQEKAYDLLADRVQLAVGTQKAGRKTSGPGSKEQGNDAVHKSTCKCRDCYIKKEAELKARKEALEAGKVPAKPGSGLGVKPTGGGGSGGELSFATIGERRELLSSPADVARLSRTIELTRTAVGHALNARSSRSHCLVHLHLTERVGGGGGGGGAVSLRKRQLLFADLAGSERILKTGAEGVAAEQAIAINTSLTALGKCVRAIAARQDYVPYRESTLTQLLRASLSGRASLAAVVTVAADLAFVEESKCSLEYGQRMGAVRTRAAVVRTTSAAGEERAVQLLLSKARPALAEMEANGYAERFGKAANPGEVRTFLDNRRRLAELDSSTSRDKAALTELQARGEGRSGAARELLEVLRDATNEAAELRELVAAQKSIAGFWIAPRDVYVRKLAEIRALEGRLQHLSDEVATTATTASTPHDSTNEGGGMGMPH